MGAQVALLCCERSATTEGKVANSPGYRPTKCGQAKLVMNLSDAKGKFVNLKDDFRSKLSPSPSPRGRQKADQLQPDRIEAPLLSEFLLPQDNDLPSFPSPRDASRATASKLPQPGRKATEAEIVRLKEIDNVVKSVMTTARKHATSTGSSFFLKERFFAAIPSQDSPSGPADTIHRLQSWRNGSLCYWANEADFSRHAEPKGSLKLRCITKVSIDKAKMTEVTVKHVDGEETVKLVLQFPDNSKAEKWQQAVRALRSLL